MNTLNLESYLQDNFLAGHANRFVVLVCEVGYQNGNPAPLPTGCTREQMATYGYTSTLLGAKSNQNYLHIMAPSTFETQVMKPLEDVSVGTPINDYYMISGTHVYARDFSNVKVLVNPSTSSYIVSLGGNYKKLDGSIVSSITMNPHTGEILLKI